MALKEYNIGDYLFYNDLGNQPDGGRILKRYSASPGGPLTYYEVECGDSTATVHISQVVDYKPKVEPTFAVGEKVIFDGPINIRGYYGEVIDFWENAGDTFTYKIKTESGLQFLRHAHQMYKIDSPVKSIREEVLDEAKRIVMKDRNLQYGSAEDNFKDIAEMWTTYSGHEFKAHDVAAMMIMVKLSRIKTSPNVADHWIDAAGYSACGAQAYDVHP